MDSYLSDIEMEWKVDKPVLALSLSSRIVSI